MSKVLIVYCSLTGNTKAAAEAIAEGAKAAGAQVMIKEGTAAQPNDLLECDVVALGSYGRAIQSIESIAKSFKFKKVAESVLVKGKPEGKALTDLRALGAKIAEAGGK